MSDSSKGDVEYQYNPRKAVANVEAFAQRAAALSAATRQRRSGRLDVPYADGELAQLDVFPAAGVRPPLQCSCMAAIGAAATRAITAT